MVYIRQFWSKTISNISKRALLSSRIQDETKVAQLAVPWENEARIKYSAQTIEKNDWECA